LLLFLFLDTAQNVQAAKPLHMEKTLSKAEVQELGNAVGSHTKQLKEGTAKTWDDVAITKKTGDQYYSVRDLALDGGKLQSGAIVGVLELPPGGTEYKALDPGQSGPSNPRNAAQLLERYASSPEELAKYLWTTKRNHIFLLIRHWEGEYFRLGLSGSSSTKKPQADSAKKKSRNLSCRVPNPKDSGMFFNLNIGCCSSIVVRVVVILVVGKTS
tara:strand:- start:3898 stop:4539 length:642 start_codon:yes stop_codon:yes gene_type:complete